jgi:hypothetical protein
MSALVEHLTKAEQAVEFALRDLRAVQAMPEVSAPNVMLMGALIQQADSLHKLIGMVREAATEWTRDDERTYTTLLVVGGYNVPLDAISSWSDEECEQAEEWATALHYYASDNDDVVVPPVPAWVAHWATNSPITI